MRTKKNPRDKAVIKQISDDDIAAILEKIGLLLKEKRRTAGSLEDVSYEARISRSALARYEKGGDMQLSNFIKLLHSLNIQPEDFFVELKGTTKTKK